MGAVLAGLGSVRGARAPLLLLIGARVHGAPQGGVRGHGGPLARLLGAWGVPLRGRWEPSLLRHGGLAQGGMGAHIRHVPRGLGGHLGAWDAGGGDWAGA